MIPAKRYSLGDYWRILSRRKWLVVLPFVLVSTGAFLVARWIPDRYRSETLILVVPQRIPQDYVQPTVTTRLEDRLDSINQQILSRTRLEQIILDFDLYVDQRNIEPMEEIVQLMRKDVGIQLGVAQGNPRQANASPSFRISYTGSDPRTVMRVTERLATLYIEENLRDREAQAESANQFLEAQVEEARKYLIEHEKKLEAYRLRFSGELPSQVQANMQAIQNTQLQIQALAQSMSQDRDRRLMIDRLLVDAEPAGPSSTVPGFSASDIPRTKLPVSLPAAQRLKQAKTELRVLEQRLKPEHPDIVRMERTLAELEKEAEQEALEPPLSPESQSSPVLPNPLEIQRQTRFREMRAERATLDQRIVEKEAEEQRLRDVVAGYQARLAATPKRETELMELTRDYDPLRGIYTSLLAKRENAKAASNLERRQIGEQFKVLDPARTPEKPFTPNRVQINSFGALAGLAAGMGLLLLVEYRDRSLRTEDEVVAALALPVLALIPLVTTTAEQQLKRRNWIVGLAIATSALVGVTLVVWKLRLLERWI
jgi:protein tyrosine kinase modulator